MPRTFDTPFNGGAPYAITGPLEEATLRRVRLTVCAAARDTVEAGEFLQALGLKPYSQDGEVA